MHTPATWVGRLCRNYVEAQAPSTPLPSCVFSLRLIFPSAKVIPTHRVILKGSEPSGACYLRGLLNATSLCAPTPLSSSVAGEGQFWKSPWQALA